MIEFDNTLDMWKYLYLEAGKLAADGALPGDDNDLRADEILGESIPTWWASDVEESGSAYEAFASGTHPLRLVEMVCHRTLGEVKLISLDLRPPLRSMYLPGPRGRGVLAMPKRRRLFVLLDAVLRRGLTLMQGDERLFFNALFPDEALAEELKRRDWIQKDRIKDTRYGYGCVWSARGTNVRVFEHREVLPMLSCAAAARKWEIRMEEIRCWMQDLRRDMACYETLCRDLWGEV